MGERVVSPQIRGGASMVLETATLSSGLALTFGILHALEPGHGKTALMTYLASGKRSVSEGVVIAITSAATHSLAVLVIAIFCHYLIHHSSSQAAAEGIGEVLAMLSGALIAGLGLWVIRKAWQNKPIHSCSSCGGDQHHHDHSKKNRNRFLTSGLLGFATGIIPCPTIVVAFLTGLSTGNSFVGLQNVLLFALGMGISLLTVILLFNIGALKVRKKLKPRVVPFNWNYLQGAVFILIGLFTAFYH